MPYGNKMPKKMGCSGGGPNMYKMGSKENNSPANFSNKAMKYMEKMPAMYGKPKKYGDNIIKDKETGEARKTKSGEKVVNADRAVIKKLQTKLGRRPTIAEYNKAIK